jgi:hypothetical protein
MTLIEENFETMQAVLPEMMANRDLRTEFYRQFAEPLAALLEQYVEMRIASGDIRPINAALAVRSVQGMFIGLMVLRILGDGVLADHWNDLPEVLVDMLFKGLSLNGAT